MDPKGAPRRRRCRIRVEPTRPGIRSGSGAVGTGRRPRSCWRLTGPPARHRPRHGLDTVMQQSGRAARSHRQRSPAGREEFVSSRAEQVERESLAKHSEQWGAPAGGSGSLSPFSPFPRCMHKAAIGHERTIELPGKPRSSSTTIKWFG